MTKRKAFKGATSMTFQSVCLQEDFARRLASLGDTDVTVLLRGGRRHMPAGGGGGANALRPMPLGEIALYLNTKNGKKTRDRAKKG